MYRLIFLSLLLLAFVGCSKPHPPLQTVHQVDIQKYLGTWYEIARYEHFFEKGCRGVTATYSLREDGDINVLNRCVKEDGELSEAVGVAYAIDETGSKLKVSFFRPFYGNYWILMLDENYQYAVIGDPSREYLWILSRTPALNKDVTDDILKRLPDLGYSIEPLVWTKQGAAGV